MSWKNTMAMAMIGGMALVGLAGPAFADGDRAAADTATLDVDVPDTLCTGDCGAEDPIDDLAIEEPTEEDIFFCCNPDLCWESESQFTCELELVGECERGQHIECYGQTRGGGGECSCTND